MSLKDFTELVKEKTPIERQNGVFKRWVHNPDHLFSEEDQAIRRRIQMRGYLKDLYELQQAVLVTPTEVPVAGSSEK